MISSARQADYSLQIVAGLRRIITCLLLDQMRQQEGISTTQESGRQRFNLDQIKIKPTSGTISYKHQHGDTPNLRGAK